MPLDHDDDHKLDARENIGVNTSGEPPIGVLIGRRDTFKSLAASTALAGGGALLLAREAAAAGPSSLRFRELAQSYDETHHVAEGYEARVLIRAGDPVVGDAPQYSATQLTPEGQALQFGYNCDFIGFHPLPAGSNSSTQGLLCVNHEYTNTNLLFPGIGEGRPSRVRANRTQSAIEIEAHGMSVIEIRKEGGSWSVVQGSRYARRITGSTPIGFSGPAAGHDKLKTSADPTGRLVLGTLNNCAGGETTWGTVLTAEENFNGYFGGNAERMPDAAMYKRYGVSSDSWYSWVQHFDRFNVEKEPNEPNRFGWIVEIDPYDPTSQPVKRTALGRLKHEGCHHAVAKDGRVVVYTGDDERFEYVYKFVTTRPWNPGDRAANRDLLDDGTLYVAQFADDGKVKWLPLVQGQGPLTAENGFATQADVLINTRRAADLLKATPMDRPEDVEANPATGRVYVILTNNTQRTPEQVNRANPRARNAHGHIIEIANASDDHAALEGSWGLFLAAGRPGIDAGTQYHRAVSENGWLSCPDNCAFDPQGRIWIATDGAPTAAGIADGLYAADTRGMGRALPRLFFTAPSGAEVCGPCFTPDGTTLFLAIQHPGEEAGSTFEKPSTRWPDFKPDMPPRPSVIVITRLDGGAIGS